MRHSIFSVIIGGIIIGAMFFFVPKLVVGIFIVLVIIRLLHFGIMGHSWYGHYGHGYRHGCDCGYGPEGVCDCGHGHDFHHEHHHDHHDHHHGHGPMHDHMYYWVDKVRNMSEEEFTEFKNNMNKGFGYGYWGKNSEGYTKCRCGEKNEADCDCDSTDKKEETTK